MMATLPSKEHRPKPTFPESSPGTRKALQYTIRITDDVLSNPMGWRLPQSMAFYNALMVPYV